jgi:hypothetical protein
VAEHPIFWTEFFIHNKFLINVNLEEKI